ncbi:MAG: hemolysin family protein [Lachnospiraceae bacterium]|nr:hemolysin family protein [Ruminococcus sp.]MCM1275315.1 hemolysin family protein [Lachnospiraceae bacterium]
MNGMNIAAVVILIALSAFFSASETAISSVNRIRLKNMAENGSRGAARALKILKKYDKALTTILIGNNIVNIATSSLATIMAIAVVGEQYGSLVATVVTTLVVLIFGEVMPKGIAKDHAEGVCIGVSAVVSFLMIIFTPFSVLFILLKKGVAKLFKSKQSVSVTEEELMAIIDEIEDEGVLEQQESNLVRSALMFDEITVDEIITPRVRIVAVDATDSADEVREKFLREEYSRMPVVEKTLDNIIGIINEKDFIKAYEEKGSELMIRELIQETVYLPSMVKISEVLRTMQKKKCHMSVVLDQHGGTLGIVTMEDLLEELVGEIWDESDEVKSPVTALSDRAFSVYGDVSLNSLRRYFSGRDIEASIDSEAHTVAGWVLELFGSIPKSGDATETEKLAVTVLEAEELRVNRVKIELKEKPAEDE